MKLTIVTPSLNGIEHLRECIESVQAQQADGITVEHIFVDGGSTDGTPELARKLGCLVLTREERSPYAALNKGSRHATGTLLGMVGCDDVMLPGALATVAEHYGRTGTRWLVGETRWLTERGYRGVVKPPPRWLSAPMYASLGWSCVPHISTFLRTDLFDELGGYDPDFVYTGDYDFFARLLARHEPFTAIRRPLCALRRGYTNLSMTCSPEILAEHQRVEAEHAPSAGWQRAFYRYLLKLWLNARSPAWFAYKRMDARGARSRAASRPA